MMYRPTRQRYRSPDLRHSWIKILETCSDTKIALRSRVQVVTKKIAGLSQTRSSRRRCRCILDYLLIADSDGQSSVSDRGQRPRLQQKLIDFARSRPFVRTLRQSRPNWIFSHIIPFLVVTFLGTQEVIEKLALPDRCCSRGRCPRQFENSSTAPAFPRANKD